MAKCQYCSYLSFIYIQIYWVKFDIPRKGKLMSPNIQCLERAPAPTPTSRLNLITFVSFPPSANNAWTET